MVCILSPSEWVDQRNYQGWYYSYQMVDNYNAKQKQHETVKKGTAKQSRIISITSKNSKLWLSRMEHYP